MLVEKEVIAPGTYVYNDIKTGEPRTLVVTPNETKYWLEQGNAMLSSGLGVPVPFEHDFKAHPMTPKEQLLNNSGWTKEYKIKDFDDPVRGKVKDALFAVLDVEDPQVAEKLPTTIKWTSPWFNSFTDGKGKQWNNVISHIALTLRPRITAQQPFPNIAAALSIATPLDTSKIGTDGYYLSRACRVIQRKSDKKLFAMYPMAFSLFNGIALGEDDIPPKKGKSPPKGKQPASLGGKPDDNPTPSEPGESAEDKTEFEEPNKLGAKPGEKPGEGDDVDLPPLGSKAGDVSMEEVLCDLLRALGVDCEHSGDEQQFKRNLYMAAMQKVHELTNKGMNKDDEVKAGSINKGNPPGQNPIIQQEQQPMYMGLDMSATLSLEDIQKISDPTAKSIALSMYNQNAALLTRLEASEKTSNSLRDSKLKEATDKRATRVAWLTKVAPKAKTTLEEMLKQPSMALSLGDNGVITDPMDQTLTAMEQTIGDLPKLLTTDSATLSVQPQPKDVDVLSEEDADKLADDMSRRMGGRVPERKTA